MRCLDCLTRGAALANADGAVMLVYICCTDQLMVWVLLDRCCDCVPADCCARFTRSTGPTSGWRTRATGCKCPAEAPNPRSLSQSITTLFLDICFVQHYSISFT